MVQVGKAGISEGIVKELDERLETDKLVKVRFLATARESEEKSVLAGRLAEVVGCELVEIRGHTAVFFRAHRTKQITGPNRDK